LIGPGRIGGVDFARMNALSDHRPGRESESFTSRNPARGEGEIRSSAM